MHNQGLPACIKGHKKFKDHLINIYICHFCALNIKKF